jgi:hypothetical protein
MSQEADQGTGASNFGFFRQNQQGSQKDIYLEPHVMARTSVYGYNGDTFGNVDQKKNYAYFDFEEATRNAASDNEIMIKNGLSLLDDIAAIRLNSEAARQEAIDYLASLGITEIRGIPVSERIFTGSKMPAALAKKLGLHGKPPAKPRKDYEERPSSNLIPSGSNSSAVKGWD